MTATEEERCSAEFQKRIGSTIILTAKVLLPRKDCPEAWSSEIQVPTGTERADIDSAVKAWVDSLDAGIELARKFATEKGGN